MYSFTYSTKVYAYIAFENSYFARKYYAITAIGDKAPPVKTLWGQKDIFILHRMMAA